MLIAVVELILGFVFLTNRIPEWVWDFAWHTWAGYFWKNAPYPDTKYLQGAGGVWMATGIVRTMDVLLLDGTGTGWLIGSLESVALICVFLAFFVPWAMPFRQHDRDRRWKETVLEGKDEDRPVHR